MEEHAGPVVKGKRTKRQRPQSPVPCEVAASSPNTATSSAELFSTTTEEEEDMANCLILLAQGHEYRKPAEPQPPPETEDHNYSYRRNVNNYDEAAAAGTPAASPKYTSRRYLETATSTGSRAGYYVYQCKTCNRTFPSFQALGGHRASHKKPKNSTNHNNGFADSLALPSPSSAEKKQLFTLLPSSSDNEDGQYRKFSSLSLQLGSHNVGSSSFYGNNNSNNHNARNRNGGSSKVHECSICGAEFTSGQALGGHMRRHRAAPVGIANPNAAPSSVGPIRALFPTPLTTFRDSEEPPSSSSPPGPDQSKVSNLNLELDLNLPASTQDHQTDHHQHHRPDDRETSGPSKFQSPSQQQQQQIEQKAQSSPNKSSMVFSASPALVDCHY